MFSLGCFSNFPRSHSQTLGRLNRFASDWQALGLRGFVPVGGGLGFGSQKIEAQKNRPVRMEPTVEASGLPVQKVESSCGSNGCGLSRRWEIIRPTSESPNRPDRGPRCVLRLGPQSLGCPWLGWSVACGFVKALQLKQASRRLEMKAGAYMKSTDGVLASWKGSQCWPAVFCTCCPFFQQD